MNDLVKLSGLSKTYSGPQESVFALDGVDLTICSGDYFSIVGPSGAGKSTLLHVLGGLDAPTKGQVTFKGKNIYGFSDKNLSIWRNRHVGFVFQFYHLIEELNVLDNITLPMKLAKSNFSLKTAKELLRYLGIENRQYFFPSQLSGGEKQKVAFARALINDPELILCDEPTGNLDKNSQQKIVQLLNGLNKDKGKTIILVTHNLELAKQADKVLFIEAGRMKT